MKSFTRRISAILLFTFLISSLASGQMTVISGTAPGAEYKTIQVTTPGDLITFLEKPLASGKVDSTGHFSVAIDAKTTIYTILSIDFHKTELFVEPGKEYSLKIAPMNYDDNAEVNPFIQSQNLTCELADTSRRELNRMINGFNEIHSAFLMKNFNALYKNQNKLLLDTFRLQLNQYYGDLENLYFVIYIQYKLASLEQLTRYYNQAQLMNKYFNGRPVLSNNLEYMDFFNSFFSKYLTATSTILHKTDARPLLKTQDPYGTFMKFMATDTLLKNPQVRELVMLKGMMEVFNQPGYDQEAILTLLRSARSRSNYPDNQAVAENMVRFLTRLRPGTPAPAFELPGRDGKKVSLKSLAGKPVVLNFWTTYCEGCLSEMDLLKPIYDKYSDKVSFVSISADKYLSKMVKFISLKKDFVWTFLNAGADPEVLKEYDVRTYPLFVLIDRQGNIVKYPADQPSGGLEAGIQKLLEQ